MLTEFGFGSAKVELFYKTELGFGFIKDLFHFTIRKVKVDYLLYR
jgi:hypothetical protein